MPGLFSKLSLLAPEERSFVDETNRFFTHFEKLFTYLRQNLKGEYTKLVPLLKFVPAQNVMAAEALLEAHFPIGTTTTYTNLNERSLKILQKKEDDGTNIWKQPRESNENWYLALKASDHNTTNPEGYNPYDFALTVAGFKTPQLPAYLDWLNIQKSTFSKLQDSYLNQAPPTLSMQFKNFFLWCAVYRRFTLPFLFLTAAVCVVFPPAGGAAALIIVAIAASKTLRTFIENHQNIIGGLLALATVLLFPPALAKMTSFFDMATLNDLFSWVPIAEAYASAATAFGAFTSVVVVLLDYVLGNKKAKVSPIGTSDNVRGTTADLPTTMASSSTNVAAVAAAPVDTSGNQTVTEVTRTLARTTSAAIPRSVAPAKVAGIPLSASSGALLANVQPPKFIAGALKPARVHVPITISTGPTEPAEPARTSETVRPPQPTRANSVFPGWFKFLFTNVPHSAATPQAIATSAAVPARAHDIRTPAQ